MPDRFGSGLRPLLILTATIGAALALAACGSSSARPPSTHAGDDSMQSIFGGGAQLITSPDSTLEVLEGLGVDRIRVDISWRVLAPDPTSSVVPSFAATDPAAYPSAGWAVYDRVFRDALAHGIAIDATVGGPAPDWAEGGGEPSGGFAGVWRPNATDFAAFVTAVGRRYSGSYKPAGASSPLPRINFWSFWNEPNYGYNLAPQAIDHSTVEVSPMLYRGLLDAGWKALQTTGHGHDTILFGETAPRGITTGDNPGNFSGMVPLRFLRALYCVGANFKLLQGQAATARGCPANAAASARFRTQNPALFDATGFSDHPYPQGATPPDARVPGEPDYADLASLPELETTLDRAQAAYGDAAKLPIYSTEFGYHTDPPEPGEPRPEVAAAYLNWAEYISWRNPRVRTFDQYLLSDPVGASQFATGLLFQNGDPKATLAAYRVPLYLPRTVQSGGQSLEVWGCVRPAHDAPGGAIGQHVAIQLASASGGSYKTVKTVKLADQEGYFDVAVRFPHSGTIRLAWQHPGGAEVFSRPVQVSVK